MPANTLIELEENRKAVEDAFNILEKYVLPLLHNREDQLTLVDAKWSILGSFDADISHEKNMNQIEGWLKLHNRINESVSFVN
jgi:hypothetical protein